MLDSQPKETNDPKGPPAPAAKTDRGDTGAQAGDGADGKQKPKAKRRKWLRRLIVVAVLLAAAWGGYLYWHYRTLNPQTSDAYLHAQVVQVAPQVAGRVLQVPVQAHQHVTKGQLLLEIDPEPFQIAVNQAQAQLDLAKQQANAAQSAVTAARAEVALKQATLNNVTKTTDRTLALVKNGTLPVAQGDDARAALKEARSALAASQADLEQAIQQRGAQGADNAAVRAADATLAQAKLDLSYTKIIAPADGILGEINVRPGTTVAKDEALFPLVEDASYWVEANYKETDLGRIKVGQPATVSVDIYPGHSFHAKVISLSPASGAAFSLLPPENATGNWVKVTQRFPVRLRITDPDPTHPLRIGASCVVTIDTASGNG